jgi:hypothetical protein
MLISSFCIEKIFRRTAIHSDELQKRDCAARRAGSVRYRTFPRRNRRVIIACLIMRNIAARIAHYVVMLRGLFARDVIAVIPKSRTKCIDVMRLSL